MHSPEATPTVLLYDMPGSPCCRRVRIALSEKGMAYTSQVIDLAKMENKADWYLRLNPNGQVPTLQLGDRVLYESNVITEYLESLQPEPRLYPEDLHGRTEVKKWQHFEMAFSKYYGLLQYVRLLGPLSRIKCSYEDFMAEARRHTDNPALLKWEEKVYRGEVLSEADAAFFEAALYERLDLLETALQGKRYLVGEQFTHAEVAVYPRVRMYPYIGLDIAAARYPNVTAWLRRCEQRASIRASNTPLDRLMSLRLMPALIRWGDRIARSERRPGLAARLGFRLLRTLLSVDMKKLAGGGRARTPARPALPAPAEPAAPAAAPVRRSRTAVAAAPSAVTVYGSVHQVESEILRLYLRYLHIPVHDHEIDLAVLEEQAPAFTRLNPSAEVPVIRHADTLVYGWPNVLEYLDTALHVTPPLLPAEPWQKAQSQIAATGDTVVQYKYWRPLYWQYVIGPELRRRYADEAQLLARLRSHTPLSGAHDWVLGAYRGTLASRDDRRNLAPLCARRAAFLDERLRRHAFLAGAGASIGDFAEYVRQRWSLQLAAGYELDAYPALRAWLGAVEALLAEQRVVYQLPFAIDSLAPPASEVRDDTRPLAAAGLCDYSARG